MSKQEHEHIPSCSRNPSPSRLFIRRSENVWRRGPSALPTFSTSARCSSLAAPHSRRRDHRFLTSARDLDVEPALVRRRQSSLSHDFASTEFFFRRSGPLDGFQPVRFASAVRKTSHRAGLTFFATIRNEMQLAAEPLRAARYEARRWLKGGREAQELMLVFDPRRPLSPRAMSSPPCEIARRLKSDPGITHRSAGALDRHRTMRCRPSAFRGDCRKNISSAPLAS